MTTPTDPNSAVDWDPRLQPRRTKSRELASPSVTPVHDGNIPRSPTQRKPGGKTSRDDTRQRSFEDLSLARGGLLPSVTGISSPSPSNSKKVGTLADHLGYERLRDLVDRKGDGAGDSPALVLSGGRGALARSVGSRTAVDIRMSRRALKRTTDQHSEVR
ncbi:hypothetical protein MLD38_009158 [Melastoma candidum]|uniref:Uncharacterized protein n=1 Tax=Melastoma candidum TaxID=119954 RepID=A0ACB9RWU5_9MYRT|nr:hypothetical protein MLD38_009158 [Melastoma candidum]